jgi:heat shock protein HtpX
VYIQDSKDINAFATGTKPENAVVCVTQGALDQLNQEELQGVLGHELSHVRNHDVLLSTITIGVVGTIALLAEIALRAMWFGGGRGRGRDRGGGGAILLVLALVLLVLAPIFSRLVYLAMSRRREYLADASGVQLTRNPQGLAAALRKIAGDAPDDPKGSRTAASLYIVNPWNHLELESLFSTHPPLQRRIERLQTM